MILKTLATPEWNIQVSHTGRAVEGIYLSISKYNLSFDITGCFGKFYAITVWVMPVAT